MQKIYKNIKLLRVHNNMSQAELAEAVGYNDRSSIAKIEKGEVDLSQSKIEVFAKALHTTPERLTGWDEESNIFFDEIVEPQEAFKAYLQSLKWDLEEEVSNIDYENDKNGDAIPIYNGVHTLSKNGIIVQLTDDEFIALMNSAESDLNNRIIELAKAKAEAK